MILCCDAMRRECCATAESCLARRIRRGPAGASFDRVKWVADTVARLRQQDDQFYTNGGENVMLDGKGHLGSLLVPSPRRRLHAGTTCLYTSPVSKRRTFLHGIRSFRGAAFASARTGIWRHSGCLGSDIGTVGCRRAARSTSWRTSDASRQLRTGLCMAWLFRCEGNHKANLQNPSRLRRRFSQFHCRVAANEIRWYIDGRQYHRLTPADLLPERSGVRHPFFLLLNVAGGGDGRAIRMRPPRFRNRCWWITGGL